MNNPKELPLLLLLNSLAILSEYLQAAHRRQKEKASPLNAEIVRDATELSQLLKIKINQLQTGMKR